jgi:hypothetical protein
MRSLAVHQNHLLGHGYEIAAPNMAPLTTESLKSKRLKYQGEHEQSGKADQWEGAKPPRGLDRRRAVKRAEQLRESEAYLASTW